MSSYKSWLHAYAEIVKSPLSNSLPICPKCQKEKINYQFVGDPKTRIGFALIWCSSCLEGIHLSRLSIPDEFEFIPFDLAEIEIKEKVPDFTYVGPNEK